MEPPASDTSPGLNAEALKLAIAYKLMFIVGKDPSLANKHEWLNATLFAIRDRLVERWLRAHRARVSQEVRQVYYLSMEFLIGRTSLMPCCHWVSMMMLKRLWQKWGWIWTH
jgi:starch phosphorylase